VTVLWLPGPPSPDEEPWPTLGPQIAWRMEEVLVHGPGDILGNPYRLTDEWRAILYAMYEVYPDDHELAGRRRFKRIAVSVAKGLAKTEFAAAVMAIEADPRGPVRTRVERGRALFDGQGSPIGGPVRDPFIPLAAYTEEQTEDLAYGALRVMLENSRLGDEFEIGLEHIVRRSGGGEIKPVASSPSANDGARTTAQHFDETHRFILPTHKRMHQTMLNNIPKRFAADAFTFETTTAFTPGEKSVAEDTYEYAKKAAAGTVPLARTFFYFHREASPEFDITTREGRLKALANASGPHGVVRDLENAANLYDEPKTDKAYWEQVWCNRPTQAGRKAFDLKRWHELTRPRVVFPGWPAAPRTWQAPAVAGEVETLGRPRLASATITLTREGYRVKPGSKIVLGFDGSRFDDSTSLSAREISTGFSWQVGLWEKPDGAQDWEVPKDDVDGAVHDAFALYDVWRLYADPAGWTDYTAKWAGEFGADRVVDWWTNRRKAMAYANLAYVTALTAGTISNDGNPDTARHIGNAHKVYTQFRDDQGNPLWLIAKDRPDSPFKMDAAMTEVLTNEARNDAIAAGVLTAPRPQVFF